MARRKNPEESPQVAEAVATVLVIGYLAIQYAPLSWGTSALCVIVFLIAAAIVLLVWKKPHPGQKSGKPKGIDVKQ